MNMANVLNERNSFSLSVFLFLLSSATFPFYLFSSGGFQLSTFFFLLLFIYSIIKLDKSYYRDFNRKVFYYYLFMIYAISISLVWCVITSNFEFLSFILIYLIDFLVLFGVSFFLVRDERFFLFFPKAIALSVITQFILSFFISSSELRGTLFFNNPNQLGYYSLVSSAILVIFYKKKILSDYWFYPAIISALWLAQLSLSNATLISILVLLAYSTLSNLKSFIVVFVLFSLSLIFLAMNQSDFFIDRFDLIWDRFTTIGDNDDDSFAGRGYDRIWNHPLILFVGGGEGAVYRWKSFLYDLEMHSTWGTLLFSYGVGGFTLFLLFLRSIIFSEKLITFLPFIVIALYGVTHNGLRFIYFWLFLSVCLAFALRKD